MKKHYLFLFLSFFIFSCASPVFIKHPIAVGDYYYLYATFYTVKSSSNKTASKEPFSDKKYTCAIKGFPFGTLLEVTNLNNDKSVVVKVNDRPGKNVIDLSKAAFMKIATIKKGKIPVRILVVDIKDGSLKINTSSKNSKNIFYTIDYNSFKSFKNAKLENEKFLKYHSFLSLHYTRFIQFFNLHKTFNFRYSGEFFVIKGKELGYSENELALSKRNHPQLRNIRYNFI